MTNRGKQTYNASGNTAYDGPHIGEITALFDRFLMLEEPLFERDVDGVHYWHFIRFHVYDMVLEHLGWIRKQPLRKMVSLRKKISIAIALLSNAVRRSVNKNRTEADILVLKGKNSVKSKGSFIDPYTSFLDTQGGLNCIWWEDLYRWEHVEGDDPERLYYLDSVHLRAMLKRCLSFSGSAALAEEARYIVSYFQENGIGISERKLVFLLTLVQNYFKYYSVSLKKALMTIHPKVLVIISHYDPFKMFLTKCAHELGVYVVELQHGSMGRYHIGYNIRKRGKCDTLPDEIFTFGDFWTEQSSLTKNGVRLTTTGFPYFEQHSDQLHKGASSARKRILIISQEVIRETLSSLAVALARTLEQSRYEIVYKLHPAEYTTWELIYSDEFKRSGVTVVANGNLYTLLGTTDIHIGVYSTVIIESLVFEKPLILLEAYGAHYYTELVEKGRAFFARDTRDVVRIIKSNPGINRKFASVEYFWQPNSVESIVNRLKELAV